MKIMLKENKNIRIISCTLIFCIIVMGAWTSDDAYHAYCMVKNVVEGNGFTPTPGIRVNVSTCPLHTLLIIPLYALSKNMYISGLTVNFLCSFLAVYFLIFKICKSKKTIITATAVIISSKSFISYTTSGLENSLLFLLGILFVYIFLNRQIFQKKDLFFLALLEGLIAFTRMDAALIFSLSSAAAFLFMRADTCVEERKSYNWVGLIKSIPVAIAGLMPFIAWEIFSFFYYGSFFPNTMLAKLNTGYEKSEYFIRGYWYYIESLAFDVLIVVVPAVFVVIAFGKLIYNKKKMNNYVWIASGVLVYMFYIIYIGGDFMKGRHFTVIFWISLVCIVYMLESITTFKNIEKIYIFMCVLVVFNLVLCPIATQKVHEIDPINYTDERKGYYWFTGLPVVVKHYIVDKDEIIKTCQHKGIQWFYGNEEWYEYRLYDPLLSRLPAVKDDNWMVGHMEREIPSGYQETLDYGINCIEDENLKEYYDKLLFILSGDLWDSKRLKEIVLFNIGKYDYLLEEYVVHNSV